MSDRPRETQQWVIDSIEESSAAVELPDGQVVHLPVRVLPKGARQGQVLRVTLEIDDVATKQALAESAGQVKTGRNASRKQDPGGDIAL